METHHLGALFQQATAGLLAERRELCGLGALAFRPSAIATACTAATAGIFQLLGLGCSHVYT